MLAIAPIVTALAAVVSTVEPPTGESLVATTVHADVAAVAPGRSFELGVRYRIEPKWHVYWSNPGDSGVAPAIRIDAPEGVEIGAIRWPRPSIFVTPHETTFGYETDVLLRVPVTVPSDFEGDRLDLALDLEWLVCRESCLFGARPMRFSIPVGKGAAGSDTTGASADAALFERARRTTPRPVPKRNPEVRVRLDGDVLSIDGPAAGRTTVSWLPDLTPGVRPVGKAPVRGTVRGDRFSLRVPLEIRPQDVLEGVPTLAGLVLLGERPEDPAHEVRIVLGGPESAAEGASKSAPIRPGNSSDD